MNKKTNLNLIIFLILGLLAISGSAWAEDPDGLVARWKLDETSGTTAYDSAGANNGTVYGATWTTGQINGALSFDGVNDYIEGSSSPFDFANTTFTVSAWFKTAATQGMIVTEGGCYGGWMLRTGNISVTETGLLMVQLKESGSLNAYLARTATSYNTDTWYHVAAVITTNTSNPAGNHADIYVDGLIVPTTELKPYSYAPATPNWRIGARYDVSPVYFNGKIDDVRIYNRTLSAQEISDLYQYNDIIRARNPSPANSTAEVLIDTDLSWTTGTGVVSHDVYFGTGSDAVAAANNQSAEFMGNLASTTFDPGTLQLDTTYYWRIDAVLSDNYVLQGDLWSFTTASVPGQASNPIPGDGAVDISRRTLLGWTAGASTTSHDVYFGTTNPPPFQCNKTSTSFSPGILDISTTYYWRIDEIGPYGITTGLVWSFTTSSIIDPDFIGWWKFDEGSGAVAYDSVSGNNGTIYGATWTTGQIGGALSFDGSGDYILVGDKPELEPQQLTLSFWAKHNNPLGAYQGGVAKGTLFGNKTTYSYKIEFHCGTVYASIVNNNGFTRTSSTWLSNSDWHSYAMTISSNMLTVFHDGIAVAGTGLEGAIDYNKTNNNFVIGARDNGGYAINGKIDDVRLYSRALSEAEMLQLCQDGWNGKAFYPSIGNGWDHIYVDTNLGWLPGKDAASHDVYLGTSFSDVNDALPIDTRHISADSEMTGLTHQIAFVAEGRIGNNALNGDFELDLGPTTSAPYTQANHIWQNGTPEAFTLEYDKASNLVAYTVGQTTLNYHPDQNIPITDIFFVRTRAVNANTSTQVSNLVLNGDPVNDSSFAQGASPGLDILRIKAADLRDGFTLTGQSTMVWPQGSMPLHSKLAYQIQVGNIGPEPNTVPPGIFRGNQTQTDYDPVLLGETTYYWRIDERGPIGITKGDIWSFTTWPPPQQNTEFYPPDEATDVSIFDDLFWNGHENVESVDVYLGTTNPPPLLYSIGANDNVFNPGTLNSNTTHYWRIDLKGPGGKTVGPVLSFTTEETDYSYLLGHWTFDETEGDIAYDATGLNDGTVYGGATWTSGKIAGALEFDGSNDWVDVCLNNWLEFRNHSTSLWMKPSQLGSTMKLVLAQAYCTGAFAFIDLSDDGRIRHYLPNENYEEPPTIYGYTDSVITQPDEWYHIVSVMGLYGNKIYVNGQRQTLTYEIGSEATQNSWANICWSYGPEDLRIGTSSNCNEFFNGIIDDVRIYDKALSDEEVQQLYQMGGI